MWVKRFLVVLWLHAKILLFLHTLEIQLLFIPCFQIKLCLYKLILHLCLSQFFILTYFPSSTNFLFFWGIFCLLESPSVNQIPIGVFWIKTVMSFRKVHTLLVKQWVLLVFTMIIRPFEGHSLYDLLVGFSLMHDFGCTFPMTIR